MKAPLLEIKNLQKKYPIYGPLGKLFPPKTYHKAVSNMNLKLYEGETYGLVGESGCGKSTLGRVILQLYRQTSGACVYHGKSIEETAPKYIGKEIAKLLEYQKKADEYYKKSLELDKKIEVLDEKIEQLSDNGTKQEVAKRRKLSQDREKLAFQSKEYKKDASRQLREGSRTVGSLILCKDLPAVQELFSKAQKETLISSEKIHKYRDLERNYEESRVS